MINEIQLFYNGQRESEAIRNETVVFQRLNKLPHSLFLTNCTSIYVSLKGRCIPENPHIEPVRVQYKKVVAYLLPNYQHGGLRL